MVNNGFKLTRLNKAELLECAYSNPSDFLKRIKENEVFIVKNFYPGNEIENFRKDVFKKGLETKESWHPLLNQCPDYHRYHFNYENAYVKGKIHAYYHHGFYPENFKMVEYFKEILKLKNKLAGVAEDSYFKNTPENGIVTRINLHQYPKGGGYQAEHIDPHGNHALIQTIIQASTPGLDYQTGGLYIRLTEDSEPIYLDKGTEKGDLLILNPGVRHGVAPIDPDEVFDWKEESGRWIIMPIFVWSDYPHQNNIKPYQL